VGARGALVAAALVLTGCGGEKLSAAPETVRLTTPAFTDGGTIPVAYTCDGAGRPPALTWSGVPRAAAELVLVVYDEDASYTHWTAYGIPPAGDRLPANVASGENSAGKRGWTPPCPPEGDDPHHYLFALYALRRRTGLEPGADPDAVLSAVDGALGRGTVTGTYRR
jgi:Raf kinase inhibitor-like YbhB/YbcL family protein